MKKKLKRNIDFYFSGEKLYGNDFNIGEIKKWYNDEKEGYSGLINPSTYRYEFHEINCVHGYSVIKKIEKFGNVLGFGSARGDEFIPILDKIDNLTIVDPSKKLKNNRIKGKNINYIVPRIDGKLSFDNNSFDLITCFGVLHHIPNVSTIIREFSRVLKYDGYLLIREPIVSMGDWRNLRKGITKNERGIPLGLFRNMILENKLEVIRERKVFFPLLRRLKIGRYNGGNSRILVWLDYFLSILFGWNNRYHARNFLEKLRPQSVFFVLRK